MVVITNSELTTSRGDLRWRTRYYFVICLQPQCSCKMHGIAGKMHSGIITNFAWYQDGAELQVGRGRWEIWAAISGQSEDRQKGIWRIGKSWGKRKEAWLESLLRGWDLDLFKPCSYWLSRTSPCNLHVIFFPFISHITLNICHFSIHCVFFS